jgi:hypothetical protein
MLTPRQFALMALLCSITQLAHAQTAPDVEQRIQHVIAGLTGGASPADRLPVALQGVRPWRSRWALIVLVPSYITASSALGHVFVVGGGSRDVGHRWLRTYLPPRVRLHRTEGQVLPVIENRDYPYLGAQQDA